MSTHAPLADRAAEPRDDRGLDRASPDAARRTLARPAPGAHAAGRRDIGWRLSPGQRKLAVAAHIAVSVGLLGLSTALLILATVASATADPQTAQAAYRAMGIFTRGVVQPVAIAALLTGLVLSLGTTWGVFQHTWIVTKLVLTVATILCGMLVVGPAVRQAIEAPESAPPVLIAATALNVLMLGAATVISVYKPWGQLRRGQGDRRGGATLASG